MRIMYACKRRRLIMEQCCFRKICYSNYRNPDNIMTLEELYKNQKSNTNIRSKQTSNSLIKSTQVEVSKPLPDIVADYVNRQTFSYWKWKH